MPETIEAPAAPAAAPAEESATFDTAQLDAILNKIRPMPGPLTEAPAPTPEQVATAHAKAVEAAEAAPPEPVKAPVAVPEPSKPVNPFDPPPSVLGEAPVAPAALPQEGDEYGTMPESPEGGFKSKKQESQYKEWRASHEKLKADLRQLREASKNAPTIDENTAAQIADLTARNAELNAIVERTSVESHPYVRQTFDEPRRQLFAIASKALEKVDVDSGTLGRILSLEGKARVDAMDELYGIIESPSTREKVTNAIAQIDMLDEKRAEFLDDRKGNIERMTQAEKAERYRQITEQETQMAQAVDKTVDWLSNKLGFEFLRKASEPGSEQWNQRVDSDLALIKELSLKNTDPQKLLTAIALGVQAPHYRQAWQNEREGRLAAEKKLSEYEGTLPNLAGDGGVSKANSSGTLSKDDDEMAAAGILPTDSLAVQSRKLAAYWATRG